jgi:hypothetical protein
LMAGVRAELTGYGPNSALLTYVNRRAAAAEAEGAARARS